MSCKLVNMFIAEEPKGSIHFGDADRALGRPSGSNGLGNASRD
jgi:hypothetical protein